MDSARHRLNNWGHQIDGVAIGSPFAPVLSNLFMGHHEKLWLENFQDSEILFYRRYVDDTFCLFHSENQALRFFNYINSRHPNIRLTNRFHVAVGLFSNRSQMTSKCGKNKKVAHEAIAECVTDVLITF